ncbi:MAG: hypothetical protein ACK52I_07605 [Pseudomonadota bacterium]
MSAAEAGPDAMAKVASRAARGRAVVGRMEVTPVREPSELGAHPVARAVGGMPGRSGLP